MIDTSLAALIDDPYPAYARLRAEAPVAWIETLGMYWVTSDALVREVLLDEARFTTSSAHSLIGRTFGDNVLSVDGEQHARYRRPLQAAFMPTALRGLENGIAAAAATLVAGFAGHATVELRAAFASRLPVLSILLSFGLPAADEPLFRDWYDAFEAALSNFSGDAAVTARASEAGTALADYLSAAVTWSRIDGQTKTLIGHLANADDDARLTDDEIVRNLGIVFFGAISTVEALILNTLWALAHNDAAQAQVRANPAMLDRALDETMRWLSPVQSATRHAVADTRLGGVRLRAGDTVNCMIAAANRDPARYADPDRFDIDRPGLAAHLGFATGAHHCLGFRLAKLEARIGISRLLAAVPVLRLDRAASAPPSGFEFRQPRRLVLQLR